MSWKATYEFIVALEQLRNIDLFGQGLYYLQVQISTYDHSQKVQQFATPYYWGKTNTDFKKKNIMDYNFNELESPYIVNGEQQLFRSQVFTVKFQEEEIPLNVFCCFRKEIKVNNDYPQIQFKLKAQLFYSLMSNMNNPAEGIKFKEASKFEAIIKSADSGLHEYLPIVFDKNHCCIVESSFHSLLLDFKFRSQSFEKYQQESEGTVSSQSSPIRKGSFKSSVSTFYDETSSQKKKEDSKEFYYETIHHLFSNMTYGFQKSAVKFFEQHYVGHLKNQYDKLLGILGEFGDDMSIPSIEQKPQIPHQTFVKNKDSSFSSSFIENQDVSTNFLSKIQDSGISMSVNSHDAHQNNNQPYERDLQQLTKSHQLSLNYQQSTGDQQQQQLHQQQYFFQNSTSHEYQTTHLEFQDQQQFVFTVQNELNELSGNLFQLWRGILDTIQSKHCKLLAAYMASYRQQQIQFFYDYSIFTRTHVTSDIFICQSNQETHTLLLEKHRQNRQVVRQNSLPNILVLHDQAKDSINPIFFEEIYFNPQQDQEIQQIPQRKFGNHLIVLCHGFQGTSFDIRLIKNSILREYPTVYCLASMLNESQTDKDLNYLGQNLAIEIKGYIAKRSIQSLRKLSFVGHSMGGLIIRASLPYLREYQDIMHSFISIGTPHIGCLSNNSFLIDAGLWIMQKIHKSKSLLQLQMKDASSIPDTFLYKLSQEDGLRWFTNIMLISSHDDKYVCSQSAGLFIIPPGRGSSGSDSDNTQLHLNTMVENIKRNFKASTIIRLDVRFKLDTSIDQIIGRAAHIHFLENEIFNLMLAQCYPTFFS